MILEVKRDISVRKDVMLDRVAIQNLKYHSNDENLQTFKSLASQFPQHAMLYQQNNMQVLEISKNIKDAETKPPVRLVGEGRVGAEIALNLAEYLVTHIDRDDIITDLAEGFAFHVLISGGSEKIEGEKEDCPNKETKLDPELTKAVKQWTNKRDFIFAINFISGSNQIFVHSNNSADSSVCHHLGDVYKNSMQDDTSQCKDKSSPDVQSSSHQMWTCPEISIGLSCCDAPQGLGLIWASHRKPILETFKLLQGLHGEIYSKKGEQVQGSDIQIKVHSTETKETNNNFNGHFWNLLLPGKHPVEIKAKGFLPLTKIINIIPGKISKVVFELEAEDNLPLFVLFTVVGTGFIIVLVVMVFCKMRRLSSIGKPYRKDSDRSRKGFELLGSKAKKELFDDSDEEDLEMDRTLAKFGLKNNSHVYRDVTSSSDEEDGLLNRNTSKLGLV
jgi:hypothetical protein